MIFSPAEKSPAVRPSSSGLISRSAGLSEAMLRSIDSSPRISVNWVATLTTLVSSERFNGGVPTLTAMMMSAPMARAASTGRLSTRPPSTSSRPLTSTGGNAPGTDIEARRAVDSAMSFCSSTALPFSRSVPMAAKGTGSRARSLTRRDGPASERRKNSSRCVPATPCGSVSPPSTMPSSKFDRFR